ncbi:MAG: hypothetical protein IE926_10975, partial [Micrococcales bacterium]|nr:hypothetical protein [Micrococcales bacterium]
THTEPWPGHGSVWVTDLLATLTGLVLVAAVVVLLRPSAWQPVWRPDEELEVRRLLRDHGATDSLAYLATRRDKALVFSPDRRAAGRHDG